MTRFEPADMKKLEAKGLLTRTHSEKDERNLIVTITDAGKQLREDAVEIPSQIAGCTNLTTEEGVLLYKILYKILGKEGEA